MPGLQRRLIPYLLAVCPCLAAAKPPACQLYPLIWKWMGGKTDSAYHFNRFNAPEVVTSVSNAFQVRRAREFWYQKNMDSFNAGRHNWLQVTDFLGRFQTIRGFGRANIDMVEQIMGGFTVHITPSGRDSIKFTVLDIKSRRSMFLHIPLVGNRPFDPGRKRQKPMTNMSWYFEWTEPVCTALFYQRQYNVTLFPHRHYTGHNF